MFKIYGIPNCDTVKKAKTFLEKSGAEFEFVDFKKSPPTADDIDRWGRAFGGQPLNKSGLTYKKHKEEFEKLSAAAQIPFIIKNSSMIKRPILEKNGKVLAFGFKEEEYKSLVK